MKRLILASTLLLALCTGFTQVVNNSTLILDYESPVKMKISSIELEGNNSTDPSILILMSGLRVGQVITVPGDELRTAVERLWQQQLFKDVEIQLKNVKDGKIDLVIKMVERPRLSRFSIKGLKKSETNDIRDEIDLQRNQVITEDLINQTRRSINEYFYEKGYYGIKTSFTKEEDKEKPNFEIIRIDVDKGRKVKVEDILFVGNDNIESKKLRRLIKPKRKKRKLNIFASSKFIEDTYEETKPQIVALYKSQGYRDVSLEYDSIIRLSDDRVNIKIKVNEGRKYYYRNITWVGNVKYRSSFLDTVLGIEKGDIYDQSKLEMRLYQNPAGFDISSLYMDDGYLFFNVNPVEVLVENDSIDLELRVFEGKQATVNRVTVIGNDKTSDFVVLRVLRTRPGDKFSRSDIQRSMRELASLGFFDPEALDVKPMPNPSNGTVDIEYVVIEKPSDQIEASGGWGGGGNFGGFVGTLGLTLNNFSTRKMFEEGGWNPIPSGDGQKLSLRAQSNGVQYQGYSFSFTEPWLGGAKPNSLSFSVYHSVQAFPFVDTGDPKFKTTGATISFGKRVKWPDDYFTINAGLSYQRYLLQDWTFSSATQIGFSNGFANNLSLTGGFSRNSTNQPIYPTEGSNFNTTLQITPPYSKVKEAFRDEPLPYETMTAQDRFKWIELYKVKFSGQWFMGFPQHAKRKFVFAPAINFGYVGLFNKQIGYSPFEQFRVGGSGLSGFVLYGTDIISQRGYDEGRISDAATGNGVKPIFTKYTLELRYPLTVGQSSTIYAQTFLEAGNAFNNIEEFNPFQVRRAGGIGVRLFLPMFGLLGVDYAWALDPIPGLPKGQLHFFIGQQF